MTLRLLCWSEDEEPAEIYPRGIHGALVRGRAVRTSHGSPTR